MGSDMTLSVDGGYFNYRAGAVILHENKLLMVKNALSPYYYSVGGRVKFGETAEQAVLREAYEETQLRFDIERLAFVHENFFTGSIGDTADKPFHELALFFLMKPRSNINDIKCESLGADGGEESLHWLPIEKLAKYQVYPVFFVTELREPICDVKHFLTTQDGSIQTTRRCL